MALLFAAAALPATALAQETVTPPTVLVPTTPAPAPQPVTPPPVQAPVAQTPPSGESRTTIAPGVAEQAQQEARERAAARQAEARPARPTRAVETPQRSAPVAAPVAADPAPVAEPAPTPAEPVAQTPPPVTEAVADPVAAPAETNGEGSGTVWLILAALGGVAALIAGAMLLRRRREDEPYIAEEVAVAAPVEPVDARRMPDPVVERPVADPVAAAPAFVAPRHEPELDARIAPVARAKPATPKRDADKPALENATLSDADPADVAAVLGGASPSGTRPQLELAMRPIRAGMGRRGASVGFELTVANAGGAPAEDVRIGAFILGEHSAQQSEIERMLTNPPSDSSLSAETIAPGDGATLEAMLTMPRDKVDAIIGDDDGFTPVLVADARYRLPDGREGRTAAAFRIGRSNGGTQLEPIAIQDDPSMYADVEAELVGVPAKV
ncbi:MULTISPECIES: hypothetical protein [unclassified Sphingomonas]|uniref:hypothetical protein n=1 Tax=unclassified Sphingomonas TaxID=196159 RepID=UPI0008313DE8|nr:MULTISPECIES: hypothetical protein [unclassified Sphingomonas]